MDFKLKAVANLTTVDEIIYPFSMQRVGDILIHRLKNSIEVLKLKKEHSNRENKIQLIKVKTETSKDDVPELEINEKKIFDSADWNEKNLLILSPNLLPSCLVKFNHYIKSQFAIIEPNQLGILAGLTTSGIIEIYHYFMTSHQLIKLPIDLTELRKKSVIKDNKCITNYKHLVETYNAISFKNIEWCPLNFDGFTLLAVATSSNDLIIYRIQNEIALQEYQLVINDVNCNEMKWTFTEETGHNLFIATEDGNLRQFQITLLDDGKVKDVLEKNEIKGKEDVSISNIFVYYYQGIILLLCCKSHTLEIFQITNAGNKSQSRYIGLNITGLDECGELEFILTTLNSKIVFLKLNQELEIEEISKLEIAFPSDAASEIIQHSSKMGYYGIATSKNNVLVYISCFPHHPTDHLKIKQPAQILVNIFTDKNPQEFLINNLTNSLYNYADCVEATRLLGITNLETLRDLEEMAYDIRLDESFMYYLKIQLMIVNIKLFYYHNKSDTIVDIYKGSRKNIMEMIKAINIYILLNKLLDADNHTDNHLMTIRAMNNYLTKYCKTTIEVEPFQSALKTLTPEIRQLIDKCQKVEGKTSPEVCDFCEELIEENELVCSQNHEMKRCAITNLLIEINCKNFCSQCLVSVSKCDVMANLFKNALDYIFCPFCDGNLTFYE